MPWCKSPFAKSPLVKTTGHATSIFQNYKLENKLLQELVEEMDIIIPNTLQSTTAFIKFIRDEQDQLEFVTPILSFFFRGGSLTICHVFADSSWFWTKDLLLIFADGGGGGHRIGNFLERA